jgi:hypothetical protein
MTGTEAPEITTTPIADRGSQGGKPVWPSEELASKIYDAANWGLVFGLVIGVVSTFMLVWMGNVKEAYLRRAIADTNERAAEANRIAEQERVARLKLEQSFAPRGLTIAQGNALIAALKSFADQKFMFATYPDDREAVHFCEVINEVLQGAGWKMEKSDGFLAFSLEFGVSVMVDPKADGPTQLAATSLIAAFNAQGRGDEGI